jgi:cephalosporin hydroxylase
MRIIRKLRKSKLDRADFNAKSIFLGHHRVTYREIKTIKSPFEFTLYQMLLFQIKPDLVIEIGTNQGGGALYIADILDLIGNGIVHTIDVTDSANAIVKTHPRISFFSNGWQDYDIELTRKFSRILIIEDSSHTYDNTLSVLKKFSPFVSVGSYIIIEDGIVDEVGLTEQYLGGPIKAIKEFLNNNNNFIIDRYWCDFFGQNATLNVNGFLKRMF